MDTPTKPYQPTHISLCTGYGGLDLGLKRVLPNLRTVAYSEVDCAAVELLLARMESGQLDPAPIWSDLRTFPWEAFSGRVGILSGGYPCQPFSSAGKRLGTNDERHLWPFIADGVRLLRPRICFFENVEGHVSLGLSTVISDLESMGYKVSFGLFSAAEVGAPHRRKRVFVMADHNGKGLEGYDLDDFGLHQPRRNAPKSQGQVGWGDSGRDAWPSRPSEPQHWWEPPRLVAHRQAKPKVCGDADGTPGGVGYGELCVSSDNHTDELRMLGNGVVPATAAKAFLTLIQAKHESSCYKQTQTKYKRIYV